MPEAVENALITELEFYRRHRSDWIHDHIGEFVLVHGQELGGFYAEYETALRAGLRAFGIEPFLIKQICAQEPVFVIY